jgi:hypothetical protein
MIAIDRFARRSESIALLTIGKFFSLVFDAFRLLVPLLFNRHFAGHWSLPEIVKDA